MTQKIIIGLAGEMASGKSTMAQYLRETHHAVVFRFSNILRDALTRIHKEKSRQNLQIMSTMLREIFGQNILAKTMAHDVQKTTSTVVAIDGVRRISDIEHLKELPGFYLVYIEADIKNCYDRITVRGENVDDNNKSFEEFVSDRKREAEVQIKELRKFAATIIDNNGSKEQFYEQMDRFIRNKK